MNKTLIRDLSIADFEENYRMNKEVMREFKP
jgi:hypothetical protein